MRDTVLSASNTPVPWLATVSNDGTRRARRLRRYSMYATGAALGRSRLLYWMTYGMRSSS